MNYSELYRVGLFSTCKLIWSLQSPRLLRSHQQMGCHPMHWGCSVAAVALNRGRLSTSSNAVDGLCAIQISLERDYDSFVRRELICQGCLSPKGLIARGGLCLYIVDTAWYSSGKRVVHGLGHVRPLHYSQLCQQLKTSRYSTSGLKLATLDLPH
jgi:hypothetical protein